MLHFDGLLSGILFDGIFSAVLEVCCKLGCIFIQLLSVSSPVILQLISCVYSYVSDRLAGTAGCSNKVVKSLADIFLELLLLFKAFNFFLFREIKNKAFFLTDS